MELSQPEPKKIDRILVFENPHFMIICDLPVMGIATAP